MSICRRLQLEPVRRYQQTCYSCVFLPTLFVRYGDHVIFIRFQRGKNVFCSNTTRLDSNCEHLLRQDIDELDSDLALAFSSASLQPLTLDKPVGENEATTSVLPHEQILLSSLVSPFHTLPIQGLPSSPFFFLLFKKIPAKKNNNNGTPS